MLICNLKNRQKTLVPQIDSYLFSIAICSHFNIVCVPSQRNKKGYRIFGRSLIVFDGPVFLHFPICASIFLHFLYKTIHDTSPFPSKTEVIISVHLLNDLLHWQMNFELFISSICITNALFRPRNLRHLIQLDISVICVTYFSKCTMKFIASSSHICNHLRICMSSNMCSKFMWFNLA